MQNNLPYYQRKFETLRIDRTHGEPAPHKPILLLAVIDLIEEGAINENKIYPSPLLVETFLKYWYLVTHLTQQWKRDLIIHALPVFFFIYSLFFDCSVKKQLFFNS